MTKRAPERTPGRWFSLDGTSMAVAPVTRRPSADSTGRDRVVLIDHEEAGSASVVRALTAAIRSR